MIRILLINDTRQRNSVVLASACILGPAWPHPWCKINDDGLVAECSSKVLIVCNEAADRFFGADWIFKREFYILREFVNLDEVTKYIDVLLLSRRGSLLCSQGRRCSWQSIPVLRESTFAASDVARSPLPSTSSFNCSAVHTKMKFPFVMLLEFLAV